MLVSLITLFIKHKFPDVKNISTEELTKLDQSKTLLVDARAEHEYEVSCIPGAVHLQFPTNSETVKTFLSDHLDSDTENIVCYCSLGYRSSVVARLIGQDLLDQNHIRVYNLEGSIFKWVNENREVMRRKSDEKVNYAHPFNYLWGTLGLNLSKWRWE